MKESEFIELLNLYLDHEISAADAARLEAEVQSNQGRRKVYQQYCRMQKACKLLAADFQTEVVGADATSEKKVVAFDPWAAAAASARRTRNNWIYATGGLAAAACIALVALSRGSREAAVPSNSAQNGPVAQVSPSNPTTGAEAAPANQVATTASGPLQLGAAGQPARPLLVADSLSLAGNPDTLMAASMKEANEQFRWITALQIAPLEQRPEELRFDLQPATLRPDARMITANRTREGGVEMNAFRFTK